MKKKVDSTPAPGGQDEFPQLAGSISDLLSTLSADIEAAFVKSEKLRREAFSRLHKTLSTLPPKEMGRLLTTLPLEIHGPAGTGKSAAPGGVGVGPTSFALGNDTAFGVKFTRGNLDVSVGVIVGFDGVEGGGFKVVKRC